MDIKEKIRTRAERERRLKTRLKIRPRGLSGDPLKRAKGRSLIRGRIKAKLSERSEAAGKDRFLVLKKKITDQLFMAKKAVPLGEADAKTVYIPPAVRKTHMHVIGASGRGKSKFIEGLIRQDIINGDGVCLIDPHGYLFKDIVNWCAEKGFLDRRSPKNIILFDPSVSGWSFGFNPLPTEIKDLSFVVDSMIKGMAKVWGAENTDKTPLLERCLRAVFYVLAERRLSLIEAPKLLKRSGDGRIREYLVGGLKHTPELVRDDWEYFNTLKPKVFEDYFMSTINRLGRFVNDPTIKSIVGQTEKALNVRRVMDESAVILVNLGSSGRPEDNKISAENLQLLGTLIINEFLNRSKERPESSSPFYLYIDECSLFLDQNIERILVECRKFGLHLILAHQTLGQLRDEKLRGSEALYQGVMGGAQTKVVFGGLPAVEAVEMANEMFFSEFNLKNVKSTKPTVVGYEKIYLQSHSQSQGTSRGTSWGESHTTGQSNSRGSNQGGGETRQAGSGFLSEDTVSTSKSSGESENSVHSEQTTSSYGTNEGEFESESWGESEALKPILKDLPDQYYTLEEEKHKAAVFLKAQPTQYAIIKIPEGQPIMVKTPTIEDGSALPDKIEAFKLKSYELTYFAHPRELVEKEIEERQRRLAAEAQESAAPEEPKTFREPEPDRKKKNEGGGKEEPESFRE